MNRYFLKNKKQKKFQSHTVQATHSHCLEHTLPVHTILEFWEVQLGGSKEMKAFVHCYALLEVKAKTSIANSFHTIPKG